MKKIFIALTVLCSALVFTGCEKMLDIQKKGVIALEDFYQTDADAESALVNAYYQAARWLSNTMGTEAGWNECPLLNPFEYASDDMFAAGENKADGVEGNQINAFWYNDSNSVITGSYHCYYMIIKAANLVIENFKDNADTPTKKRCVAEARVLRAYVHMLLTMGWYNPPIADHLFDATERPENAKDQNEILDFIISDCAAALNDLDEKTAKDDKNGAVKVTKGFCNAISAKAKMFKGDYSGAKADLKKIIDSQKYDLVPAGKMSSLYHYSGRGNEESVFEFNLKYDANVDGYYQRAQPNFKMLWGWRASRVRLPDGVDTELPPESPWGWCNPSAKFVNTILENDGYDSARRKAWIKSYDEVLYEMPYTTDFVLNPITKEMEPKEGWTKADKEKDAYRGIQDGSGLYGHVGYFMWKRLYRAEDRTDTAEIQWNLVIMRYSEVLLMYAECCAQTGDNSGLEYLNKVQTRAESKHISSTLTLAEVQKEKYIECWLEGSRFPDLVRWGIAEQELKDNGKYLPNYCDAMSSKGEGKHRGYLDESDADWCVKAHPEMGFKKEKHSYFPIPFAEKNVNPNVHDWNAQ